MSCVQRSVGVQDPSLWIADAQSCHWLWHWPLFELNSLRKLMILTWFGNSNTVDTIQTVMASTAQVRMDVVVSRRVAGYFAIDFSPACAMDTFFLEGEDGPSWWAVVRPESLSTRVTQRLAPDHPYGAHRRGRDRTGLRCSQYSIPRPCTCPFPSPQPVPSPIPKTWWTPTIWRSVPDTWSQVVGHHGGLRETSPGMGDSYTAS